MISVKAVNTRADWRAFKRMPRTLYRHDPDWITSEPVDIDSFLIHPTPERRARSATQAFVAFDNARPVGRVVAIADRDFINYSQTPSCFFGFYEAVAADDVAFALLDQVREWALENSLTEVYGPFSPSMVHSAGVLVEQSGGRPLVGMPYNPGYYTGQFERWGMARVTDLYSYLIQDPYTLMRSAAFATEYALWQRFTARSPVTFRSMTDVSFGQDLETLRTLYNRAFGRFCGFAPLRAEDIRDLADTVRPILDLDLAVFAEIDARPVGFLMAIPDVNSVPAARSLIRHARLLPSSLGPFLRTARLSPVVTNARVDMLVVDPDCHHRPTAALLLAEVLRRVHDKGYTTVEGAPILEDGSWIQPFRRKLNMQPHRIYRVYRAQLNHASTQRDEVGDHAYQASAG